LTTALAVTLTIFRIQADRLAIWWARKLIVVIGVDDDTDAMVRVIADRMAADETLVVIAADTQRSSVARALDLGARLRVTSLLDQHALLGLKFWPKASRLYLLSEDPARNAAWLTAINDALDNFGDTRQRRPLTVRVDNPWQAEVWRRSFLGSAAAALGDSLRDMRWIGDAVGRYEITAANLVRYLIPAPDTPARDAPPDTVLLCGLSPLTYALSSEFAQVHREQAVCLRPGLVPPARVIILAEDAQGFVADHRLRQLRLAPDNAGVAVEPFEGPPTVETVSKVLDGEDPGRVAVILTEPSLETDGTRLALRFPDLTIYQASGSAPRLNDSSVVGRQHRFPIGMELDADAPHDTWERAAELVHESYCVTIQDRSQPPYRPWKDLPAFFRQSNRREVFNTLVSVEHEANHTWNSLAHPPGAQLPADIAEWVDPLEQLAALGFTAEQVDTMVAREHDDWCRYYREAGWKYAEVRCDDRKRHDRLVPWHVLVAQDAHITEVKERNVHRGRHSLAVTLITLRSLGLRSVPRTRPQPASSIAPDEPWFRFRRRGEVNAQQRSTAWEWTTSNGEVMHGQAGDWAVTDDAGRHRSVAADAFASTHELIRPGRYRRTGTVLARCANDEETIATTEGPAVVRPGDWVVKDQMGHQWPVPARQFRQTYDGRLDGPAQD
jgi:hypothetical protein